MGECLPVNCNDGVVSYGRRQRRETGVEEEENVCILIISMIGKDQEYLTTRWGWVKMVHLYMVIQAQ